jgi:hypothetical protein
VVGTVTMDPLDTNPESAQSIKGFRTFVEKYMPGVDMSDTNYLFGYIQGSLLEQLLKQCGDDLSRENIIKQARNFKDIVLPMVQPGIKVNTTPQINMNFTQMRLQRWNGSGWEVFTEAIDAASE